MLLAEVIVSEEVVSLEDQRNIVVDAFIGFIENEDHVAVPQRIPLSGYVGLWWNEHRNCWYIGCCYFKEDRDKALSWYDAQWKHPARLFYVRGKRAQLRCAKLANVQSSRMTVTAF